jgi:hypothetical protein
MKKPASFAFVIHDFDPLMVYPDSVLAALVASAKASEPEPGSDRQKDPGNVGCRPA